MLNEIGRYILESHFPQKFAEAVYRAAGILVEAVNINKEYLLKVAGNPQKLQDAKAAVQEVWKQESMDTELNQKVAQKVLNFLYLMEIKSPGFTTVEKIHRIHDLYIHNLLDTKFLSKVNSDTTPENADAALSAAEEHQVQSAKVYSNLTPAEEEIWNRVKVYHEFPDGFKWVFAVDDNGNIASHIPASITGKTMHHCGNTPRAKSDDQYWELRGPDGKAYLTVILNSNGELEESKSWGNRASKYRQMIQPYVKWFFMDRVRGVGYRYDNGYSTHTNYGVKDFIGDDPEFVDYIIENKPSMLGVNEARIIFWGTALREGVVSTDDLKEMYAKKTTFSDAITRNEKIQKYAKDSKYTEKLLADEKKHTWRKPSLFGQNPFAVLCAICDGCPFNKNELRLLISDGKLSLEEFANYDIKLLDPDMQRMFVELKPASYKTLVEISKQVASFTITPDLMDTMLKRANTPFDKNTPSARADIVYYNSEASAEYKYNLGRKEAISLLLNYMAEGNPPEKVHDFTVAHIGEVYNSIEELRRSNADKTFLSECAEYILEIYARFSDLEIPAEFTGYLKDMMKKGSKTNMMPMLLRIGRPRIDPVLSGIRSNEVMNMCQDRSSVQKIDGRNIGVTCKNLAQTIEMYPEHAKLVAKMSPAYKLGYYCFAKKLSDAERREAVDMVKQVIDTRVRYNSTLSALDGIAIIAMSRFPELREELGDYKLTVFIRDHIGEIASTPIGDEGGIMYTPTLGEIVVNGLNETIDRFAAGDEAEVDHVMGSHEPVFLEGRALVQTMKWAMRTVLAGREAVYKSLFNRFFYYEPNIYLRTDAEFIVTFGYVDIPYEDWDEYIEKMGDYAFTRNYVARRLNASDDLPDYYYAHVLDCILAEARKEKGSVRGIINVIDRAASKKRLHELLVAKCSDGTYRCTPEELSTLNSIGLITKAEIKKLRLTGNSAEPDSVSIRSSDDVAFYSQNINKFSTSEHLPEIINGLMEYGALHPGSTATAKVLSWLHRAARKDPKVLVGVSRESFDKLGQALANLMKHFRETIEEYHNHGYRVAYYDYYRATVGSQELENVIINHSKLKEMMDGMATPA